MGSAGFLDSVVMYPARLRITLICPLLWQALLETLTLFAAHCYSLSDVAEDLAAAFDHKVSASKLIP